MGEINVPRLVADKLSPGEAVVGKFATRWGDYYATNQRLLLFKSQSNYTAFNNPEVSIKLVKYGAGWVAFRIFCVLFGFISIGLGVVGYIGPVLVTGTTTTHFEAPFGVSLLLWFLGLVMILIGITMRYAYYQITAPGIDKKDIKKWRIEKFLWGSGGADKFAAAVQSAARPEKKGNAS